WMLMSGTRARTCWSGSWSTDVCTYNLYTVGFAAAAPSDPNVDVSVNSNAAEIVLVPRLPPGSVSPGAVPPTVSSTASVTSDWIEIGRASWRARVSRARGRAPLSRDCRG